MLNSTTSRSAYSNPPVVCFAGFKPYFSNFAAAFLFNRTFAVTEACLEEDGKFHVERLTRTFRHLNPLSPSPLRKYVKLSSQVSFWDESGQDLDWYIFAAQGDRDVYMLSKNSHSRTLLFSLSDPGLHIHSIVAQGTRDFEGSESLDGFDAAVFVNVHSEQPPSSPSRPVDENSSSLLYFIRGGGTGGEYRAEFQREIKQAWAQTRSVRLTPQSRASSQIMVHRGGLVTAHSDLVNFSESSVTVVDFADEKFESVEKTIQPDLSDKEVAEEKEKNGEGKRELEVTHVNLRGVEGSESERNYVPILVNVYSRDAGEEKNARFFIGNNGCYFVWEYNADGKNFPLQCTQPPGSVNWNF